MQEKLGSRLIFFGRMIVVVWLLTAAAWLQKLDSLDLRDDVHDLTLLATIDEIRPADELQQLPGETFDHTLDWLASAHPDISESRAEARRQVVEWLLERGVGESQLRNASGKMSAPANGALPFHFVRVAGTAGARSDNQQSNLSPLLDGSADTTPWPSMRYSGDEYVITVSQFLDKLELLARPRELICVVDISAQTLEALQFEPDDARFNGDSAGDSIERLHHVSESRRLSSDPSVVGANSTQNLITDLEGSVSPVAGSAHARSEEPAGSSFVSEVVRPDRNWSESDSVPASLILESAALEEAGLRISYRWFDPQAGPQYAQSAAGIPFSDSAKSLALPVGTTTVDGPSLLSLSDPQRAANLPLEQLAGSTKRLAYLRRTYGHLPLDEATFLASEGLTQAYRQLGLFGITFSTRRYPLAVLLCLGTALSGTLIVLLSARQQGIPIVQRVSDAYAVDVLIASWPARCLLWAVLPLSALWAALPLVPLTDLEMTILRVGAAALALVGISSLWIARPRRRGYRP